MIEHKTESDITLIRKGGSILAKILDVLVAESRPGVSLHMIDIMTEKLCREHGVKPAFKGYRSRPGEKAFPFSVCTSVNDVIVHGTPRTYLLTIGDVLKIDCGIIYDGWNLDSARTIIVGEDPRGEKKRLIDVTQTALEKGIAAARVGNTVGDIGFAISSVVKHAGYYVVQGLTGHGIGRELHEDPAIHNEGERGKGIELVEGMVIAIEPMVAIGTGKTIRDKDDSFRTADGSLSAHIEHTVAITRQGPLILTER